MQKISLLSLTMATLLSQPAFAQSAMDSAPQSAEPGGAADIIVTATRRAQNIQDVPVSVTAISEAQVRGLSLTDTRDLVRLAPSLTFSQGSTTKLYNFTIRGIGSYVTSDGFDQSVGVAVDGVPLARPGGSLADLVDIGRVEVLEGPQGMLFGRNASAGLVNIITRRPKLNEISFTGRATYGSYNESQLSGSLNVPLSESLAARATIWRFRHDGYVKSLHFNRKLGVKDSGGARIKLLWKPTDSLTAVISGEISTADQDPSVTTIRAFANNNFGVRDFETAQGIVASPTNLTNSSYHSISNRYNNKSITSELSYDLGGPVLSSVTSYRHITNYDKFDGGTTASPVYVSNQADDISYKQFSQELRLNGDSGRLRYVLGLIYFNLDIHDVWYTETVGATPAPGSIDVVTDIGSKHYGAFGELTFDVTPELKVIAGGRISHDRMTGAFDKSYRTIPATIVPAFNGPGSPYGPLSVRTSVSNTEPSYRFGLQYDVTPEVMLYGTVSRGYKAAGLDLVFALTAAGFAANNSRVKPEIADNMEIGIRSQFFNKRLTLNATVFNEVFKDFQVAVRLPTTAPIYSVQNAKEMKATGVTFQADARPFSGLSLSASGTYVHARYTDFQNAPCYPREPSAPVGTPLTPGICVGGIQNLNGKPLSNSPKWRLNFTARQEVPVGTYKAFVQANLRYQSAEVFNSVADPYERQDGYSVTNLSAGIGPDDSRWQVSVFGNNVFGKSFIARTIAQNSGSYYVQVVPYDAQTRWGVALDVSF